MPEKVRRTHDDSRSDNPDAPCRCNHPYACLARDGPAILDLVRAVHLPPEGIAETLAYFWVAREAERIVGTVGLEVYEDLALLRSLAVAPSHQHTSGGWALGGYHPDGEAVVTSQPGLDASVCSRRPSQGYTRGPYRRWYVRGEIQAFTLLLHRMDVHRSTCATGRVQTYYTFWVHQGRVW